MLIQVISAHSEFGPVNSDSVLWRVQPATLITSASEHSGHSDVGPKQLCSEHMKFNACLAVNKASCLFSDLLIDLVPHYPEIVTLYLLL